jgi:uncharacterized protein (UPF0332 family)
VTSEDSQAAAVRYWWDKAHESLRAAHRELAAAPTPLPSIAMFYAVSALLLEEGRRFSKHSDVRAAFNRDLSSLRRVFVKRPDQQDTNAPVIATS